MKHGTISGYIRGKCRCDGCRKAYSDYRREWQIGIKGNNVRHGTKHYYDAYGCRCPDCKRAKSKALRVMA